MATTDARPVARLSSPGEMVALVPHLCGFVPSESLVAVSLRGPRKRVGLTLRMDLVAGSVEVAAAAEVAARMACDGAREVLLVVYTEAADGPDRVGASLVSAAASALEGAGIAVQDALLVRAGRWWSYRCSNPRCCPEAGVPLSATVSPALELVEATQAYDGRAVMPSRTDLVASLQPPVLLAAVAAEQRLHHACDAFAADVAGRGIDAVRLTALTAFRAAVDGCADPRAELADEQLAELVIGLHDVLVRDEVLTWALDQPELILALLHRLAGRSVPPYDAPVCTLLALVAWLRGDGGLANIALDRAFDGDPGYSLAALVRGGLQQQVPPAVVRQWLRGARQVLATGADTPVRRRKKRR